ncbi:MAG TPA: FAD-dependent oxidoreductase, partial [Thermoleophilaceae bacterium]|nr:FAD-dependent oxidoreductase [Thermoleophilaceae bacterium]
GELAGVAVDLGASWVGPSQDRINALAAELGVATRPTHTAGRKLIRWRGRVRGYRGTIPRLDPLTLIDTELMRRRFERLARSVPVGCPWAAPDAAAADARSLASWLERSTLTRGPRELMRIATPTVWGCEPGELSLLHALHYVHAAGGLDPLLEVEDGAQQDRLEGGAQGLALALAARLGPEPLVLGAPVERIARTEGGSLELRAGSLSVGARRAVVAAPPALRSGIAFDPPLPHEHEEVARSFPQGSITKVYAAYPEPFWRLRGASGEALSDQGPVTITFDATPPAGSPGILVGFVGGADARALEGRPSEERRARTLASLASLFGSRAARPLAYLEHSWAHERWSRGGPTAVAGPGAWTAHGRALREPVGPIHWAGTETAGRWTGFMDGAVRSGERAAAEVDAALR